jgi:hypothetical protein
MYMQADLNENVRALKVQQSKVTRSIRQAVIDAYGGRCCCCEEADLRALILVYEDLFGLIRAEDRAPLQGTPEYTFLYRNGFPRNGRKIACRRCARHVDSTNNFPVDGKCSADHFHDVLLKKYVGDEPDWDIVMKVVVEYNRRGWELDGDFKEQFEEWWKLPKGQLNTAQQLFLKTYREIHGKEYRKSRYHALRHAGTVGMKNVPVEEEESMTEITELSAYMTDQTEVLNVQTDIDAWMASQGEVDSPSQG